MSEPFDLGEVFDVQEVGPGKYIGKHPLLKPDPKSRAVFGGNTAGQAILVAIKSAPEGFRPHSLHSYFILPISDTLVLNWEVESISQGNNFANRHIRAYQNNKVVYYANVSLTKRNSHKSALIEYEDYQEKLKTVDEEEEDLDVVVKPFEFQTPYHHWFKKHDLDKLPIDMRSKDLQIYHKFLPELYDLSLTPEEVEIPVAERKISFLAKLGCPEKDLPIKKLNPDMQFVGLAILLDTLFLTQLARLLRIEDVNLLDIIHYMSVSLDHVVYFHDEDFDVTNWIGMTCQPTRFINKRALFECEMYNDKGVHVASVVQEGYVHLNGIENNAKL